MRGYPVDPWALERHWRRAEAGLVVPERRLVGRRRLLQAGGAAAAVALLPAVPDRSAAADVDVMSGAAQVVSLFVVLVKGLQLVLEAAQLANKIEDEIYKLFDRRDPILDKKHLTSAIGDALKGSKPPEAIAVTFNLTDRDDGLTLDYARSTPLGALGAASLATREAMRDYVLANAEVRTQVPEQVPARAFKAYPVLSGGTLLKNNQHVTLGTLGPGKPFDTAILSVI